MWKSFSKKGISWSEILVLPVQFVSTLLHLVLFFFSSLTQKKEKKEKKWKKKKSTERSLEGTTFFFSGPGDSSSGVIMMDASQRDELKDLMQKRMKKSLLKGDTWWASLPS